MNDRMTIAAMAMQGMLTALGGSGNDKDLAERAVSKADALLKALAGSEAERPQFATGAQDEVGNWRDYVRSAGRMAVAHVSARNMGAVDDAFIWRKTPQGHDFWEAVYRGNASALTITRAQDFARRVLEAMEASDE